MALVNNGVQIGLQLDLIPAAYTVPTVTTVDDFEYNMGKTLTVVKSAVVGVDAAATFTALVASINTQVEAFINADFDTTGKTVTIHTAFYGISNNVTEDVAMYDESLTDFICSVQVFIKCV